MNATSADYSINNLIFCWWFINGWETTLVPQNHAPVYWPVKRYCSVAGC